LSSLHSNLDPGSLVKAKLALVLLTSASGLLVRVVWGPEVSTVQVYSAGVGSTFSVGSIAWTWSL
jgi:hypothetical protein